MLQTQNLYNLNQLSSCYRLKMSFCTFVIVFKFFYFFFWLDCAEGLRLSSKIVFKCNFVFELFFVATKDVSTRKPSKTDTTPKLFSYTTLVSQMTFESVLNRILSSTTQTSEGSRYCNRSHSLFIHSKTNILCNVGSFKFTLVKVLNAKWFNIDW